MGDLEVIEWVHRTGSNPIALVDLRGKPPVKTGDQVHLEGKTYTVVGIELRSGLTGPDLSLVGLLVREKMPTSPGPRGFEKVTRLEGFRFPLPKMDQTQWDWFEDTVKGSQIDVEPQDGADAAPYLPNEIRALRIGLRAND